jgi:hypothetical protein
MGRQHAQEIQRQQMEALKAEIAAARQQPAPKQDNIAPMVAALVPVLTAIVQSMSQRAQAATAAQQDVMKMQMEGIKTMLTVPSKTGKEPDLYKMLVDLAPVVMPLLTKILDDRGSMPGKMAELIGTLGENNMHMLSMVSEFMKANDTGESPTMAIIRQAIDGGLELAKQMTNVSRAAATAGSPQLGGGGSGKQGAPVATLTPQSPPKDFAQAIFNSPNLPAAFKTQQWFNLFAAIHDPKVDAAKVGVELAKHLEDLEDAGKQVPAFEGLFNEDSDTEAYIKRFLGGLPLASYDVVRAQAIVESFTSVFVPVDDAESDEDDSHSHGNGMAQPEAFQEPPIAIESSQIGLRKS